MLALAILSAAVLFSVLGAPTATLAAESITVQGQVVDAQGAPVADTTVFAVQKTWPNNRYRQRMLKTTTDKQGRFAFKDFAERGKKYAFLLSVISDHWLLTSEYRVAQDGKQQEPITLQTEKSDPVTFVFVNRGQPLAKVRAVPARRTLADGSLEYLSYAQHVGSSGAVSNESGEVQFGSWKVGEKGAIVYLAGDEAKTFDFTVPLNRKVFVAIEPSAPKPPAGPPVYVAGQVVDADGKALAGVQVLAIQKTWPNNRYQQNALTATTDQQGKFRFNDFAAGGSQYAFLLTVLADGYAMTSEYRLVRDGKQQSPVTLKLETAEPVTLTIKDAAGKPLQGVEVCPASRSADESTVFLNYSLHMEHSSRHSDEKGEVSFTAWKPGETGEVHYRYQQQYGELKFTVGQDRTARITLPQP